MIDKGRWRKEGFGEGEINNIAEQTGESERINSEETPIKE
jgi:hypothetical protein